MNKKSEKITTNNPQWSDDMFDNATTLDNSNLPDAFKVSAKRGRPLKEGKKVPISIRLSPEVLSFFKQKGKGWQSRIDDTLKSFIEHR
ncbi:MAG: hypothetical protein HN338_04305 [Candidatus Ruthia sp.]|jgi:uncharacterized protein (DUF4415 family)|nr:hypothetical protein [Candidatus Ruthturnera sp.]